MIKKDPIEKESDLLRLTIEAKDQVIAAWKDRGDRYAAHNDALQAELKACYQLMTKFFLGAEADSASEFKKLLEKALERKKG